MLLGKENMDSLTGILKKGVAEAKITSILNRKPGGAVFLCDVDCLKGINEKYGHLVGDECLKQVAQILTYMTNSEDILGRWGGDEFIIYKPNCRDVERAQETRERIEKRFHMNRRKEKGKMVFSVTVVCALWRSGDTCRKLVSRACEELEKCETALYMANTHTNDSKDQYIMDVRRVRKDLIEQINIPGAYCQDYETFKGIYRFLERGLIRKSKRLFVV